MSCTSAAVPPAAVTVRVRQPGRRWRIARQLGSPRGSARSSTNAFQVGEVGDRGQAGSSRSSLITGADRGCVASPHPRWMARPSPRRLAHRAIGRLLNNRLRVQALPARPGRTRPSVAPAALSGHIRILATCTQPHRNGSWCPAEVPGMPLGRPSAHTSAASPLENRSEFHPRAQQPGRNVAMAGGPTCGTRPRRRARTGHHGGPHKRCTPGIDPHRRSDERQPGPRYTPPSYAVGVPTI